MIQDLRCSLVYSNRNTQRLMTNRKVFSALVSISVGDPWRFLAGISKDFLIRVSIVIDFRVFHYSFKIPSKMTVYKIPLSAKL